MARSADEEAVQDIKDPKKRKEAYYTRQRQNASAGSATQKKIQSKMNFGDEVRGFAKDQMGKIQASGPWSIPGGKAAEAVEGAVGGAAKALGKGARGLAKRAGGAIESEVQHLRTPTPVQKALGSSKPALRSAKGQSKALPSSKAGHHADAAKDYADHIRSRHHADAAKDYADYKKSNTKAVSGKSQKAIGTSGQWQYEKELAGQSSKKMPSSPKTFNRNGTSRAEGRQKSTRNPSSKTRAQQLEEGFNKQSAVQHTKNQETLRAKKMTRK